MVNQPTNQPAKTSRTLVGYTIFLKDVHKQDTCGENGTHSQKTKPYRTLTVKTTLKTAAPVAKDHSEHM